MNKVDACEFILTKSLNFHLDMIHSLSKIPECVLLTSIDVPAIFKRIEISLKIAEIPYKMTLLMMQNFRKCLQQCIANKGYLRKDCEITNSGDVIFKTK